MDDARDPRARRADRTRRPHRGPLRPAWSDGVDTRAADTAHGHDGEGERGGEDGEGRVVPLRQQARVEAEEDDAKGDLQVGVETRPGNEDGGSGGGHDDDGGGLGGRAGDDDAGSWAFYRIFLG